MITELTPAKYKQETRYWDLIGKTHSVVARLGIRFPYTGGFVDYGHWRAESGSVYSVLANHNVIVVDRISPEWFVEEWKIGFEGFLSYEAKTTQETYGWYALSSFHAPQILGKQEVDVFCKHEQLMNDLQTACRVES